MQFAFAAREPILDVTQNVYAYALVFRDGKQGAIPEHQDDRQTAIERQFDTLSLKDISGDKRSLIEFTDNALINALPEFEDHTKIIAHLSHTQAKQPDVLEACEGLKRKGMLFALKLDKLETMSLLLLNMVDIVSISYAHFTNNTVDHDLLELLDTLQNNNIRLLVTDVETIDAYTHLQSYKVHYFQGYFFTQIKHSDKDSLPSSKITILELVQASNTDQFDVDKISNILERDPSLSYALLRFINNPTINKRNEITSLKHALTYLGEVEVKQFIALISIMSLNADNPTELLHVSLVRAKFLELLCVEMNRKSSSNTGFMVGLLSLLDVILDKPMKEVLEQVSLIDDIKQTLLGNDTYYAHSVHLVKGFESGIWTNIIEFSKNNQISQTRLHSVFNLAVIWANEIHTITSDYFPRTKVVA